MKTIITIAIAITFGCNSYIPIGQFGYFKTDSSVTPRRTHIVQYDMQKQNIPTTFGNELFSDTILRSIDVHYANPVSDTSSYNKDGTLNATGPAVQWRESYLKDCRDKQKHFFRDSFGYENNPDTIRHIYIKRGKTYL